MGILLTDEERIKYREMSEVQISDQIAGTYDADWVYWNIDGLLKAQLKKVAELLKACDGELVSRNEGPFMATFEMLATDYQALLEEAGLNKEVKS